MRTYLALAAERKKEAGEEEKKEKGTKGLSLSFFSPLERADDGRQTDSQRRGEEIDGITSVFIGPAAVAVASRRIA